MAATWTYTISVTDLSAKIADVTGRRHGVDVRSFTMPAVSFDTSATGKTMAQIRDQIATQMIGLYAEDVANESIEAVIRTQESLLAEATNSKET